MYLILMLKAVAGAGEVQGKMVQSETWRDVVFT